MPPPLILKGALAVIGHPIGHSLSPLIHNTALAALGHPPVFVACDVEPARLGAALSGLAALGFVGASVTTPHKERIIEYLDRLTPTARAVGAVNSVRVLTDGGRTVLEGDNTDVAGFLEPLAGHHLGGRTVALIGAGGAARAVLYALLSACRPGVVRILGRRTEQARSLAAAFGSGETLLEACSLDESRRVIAESDLVVNATPVGMHPEVDRTPCPDPIAFRSDQIVYDLVYTPRPTRLLREAAARGARTIDGLPMLVAQAALSFESWTGHPMPRAAVLEALETRLAPRP